MLPPFYRFILTFFSLGKGLEVGYQLRATLGDVPPSAADPGFPIGGTPTAFLRVQSKYQKSISLVTQTSTHLDLILAELGYLA